MDNSIGDFYDSINQLMQSNIKLKEDYLKQHYNLYGGSEPKVWYDSEAPAPESAVAPDQAQTDQAPTDQAQTDQAPTDQAQVTTVPAYSTSVTAADQPPRRSVSALQQQQQQGDQQQQQQQQQQGDQHTATGDQHTATGEQLVKDHPELLHIARNFLNSSAKDHKDAEEHPYTPAKAENHTDAEEHNDTKVNTKATKQGEKQDEVHSLTTTQVLDKQKDPKANAVAELKKLKTNSINVEQENKKAIKATRLKLMNVKLEEIENKIKNEKDPIEKQKLINEKTRLNAKIKLSELKQIENPENKDDHEKKIKKAQNDVNVNKKKH